MLSILIKRAKEDGQIRGVIPHLVDDGLSILQYADDTIIFLDHDLEQAKNTKGGARCNSYGITVKHVVRWWRYPAIDGCFSAVSCFVIELLVSCVSLLSVLYPGVVSLCSCSSGCSMAQRL